MELTRLLNFGCALLLIVCLIFSVVSILRLQTVIEDNKAMRRDAEAVLLELDSRLDELNAQSPDTSLPTGTPNGDGEKILYRIQSVGNRIGIYTADGALIQLLDIDPATLPRIDREALENGITLDSWERVQSYIADYTA